MASSVAVPGRAGVANGTRADLKPGDLIQPGYYTERRSPWVYFSETLHAATWEAELAMGEARPHAAPPPRDLAGSTW